MIDPEFDEQVQEAIKSLKRILDKERNPEMASAVPHTYEDKYKLANFVTNSAINSTVMTLNYLGVTPNILKELQQKSHNEKCSIFLRFDKIISCAYIKEEVKKIESPHVVHERKGFLGALWGKEASYSVKKVTEYHWKVETSYSITIYTGLGDDTQSLRHKDMSFETITTKKNSPFPEKEISPSHDVCIDWLLSSLDIQEIPSDGIPVEPTKGKEESSPPVEYAITSKFEIDRKIEADCRTPRRNRDIYQAFAFFQVDFQSWLNDVSDYFSQFITIENDFRKHEKIACMNSTLFEPHKNSFLPMFLLMETVHKDHQEDGSDSPAQVLGSIKSDFVKMNQLQFKDLDDKIEKTTESFLHDKKKKKKGINIEEAVIKITCMQLERIINAFIKSIHYIEMMLYDQLKNAIGKEISKKDFDDYMAFHHNKIFDDKFKPKTFSYAIRRPKHYPEGILSIESTDDSSVFTSVRKVKNAPPMRFALNAAATVDLNGPRYLHGLMRHSFGGEESSYKLKSRARQFSSFILMLGSLNSANSFDPKHAIIIKNKDDLEILLDLETIPTAKEFKEAIESMSPEQQRFAKQFRSMQMASTLFAMVVVQIKPQLEKVLNLPPGSLTKEIKLAEKLMDLFIKYQISSDLLCYDEDYFDDENPLSNKSALMQVKGHVAKISKMLDEMKEEKIAEKVEESFFQNYPTSESESSSLSENCYLDSDDDEDQEYTCSFLDKIENKCDFAADTSLNSPPRRKFMMESMACDYQMDEMSSRGAALCDELNDYCETNDSETLAVPSKQRKTTQHKKPSAKKKSMPAPKERQKEKRAGPSSSSAGKSKPDNQPETAAVVVEPVKEVVPESVNDSPKEIENDPVKEPDDEPIDEPEETGDRDDNMDDFTIYPTLLEKKYAIIEEFDIPLRPTIIKISDEAWVRKSQKSLLSELEETSIDDEARTTEKNKAFDLLDALSKSGVLSMDCAELHVVIAATNVFEKTLIDTLIQGNKNPIEKIERSMLMVSAAIHDEKVETVANKSEFERLTQFSPMLFE